MKRIVAVSLVAPLLVWYMAGAAFAQKKPAAKPAVPPTKTTPKPTPAAKPPVAPAAKPVAKAPTPETPKPAPRPTPVWSVAFTADGKRLLVGGYKKVTVYDVATGAKIADWPVAADAIRSLSLSADGQKIALGTGIPAQSGSVVVLDANTGTVVRTLAGYNDTVESVAFRGNLLITAASDERVRVSDVSNGNVVSTLTEHAGRCLSVAVPIKTSEQDGGEFFVTGGADNMVKVWDAQARRTVVNFDQCASPVWALAARPVPGHFLAGSGDGQIRYFGVRMDNQGSAATNGGIHPRTGYLERQFPAHEGGVYALAVAPNDAFFVSGGADRKTIIWNMGGGKRKEFFEARGDVWGVAISPDSKWIASASLDGRARIYDVEKGTLVYELPLGLKPLDEPGSGVAASPSAPAGMVLMAPQPGKGTGLQAEFYLGIDIGGKPAATRVDPTISFETPGGDSGPAPEISGENFSARWTGWIEAPVTGSYRFHTFTDDGVRLWVNGKQVIDNWTDHGGTEDTSSEQFTLVAGQVVSIRMEFFQGAGGGVYRLLWSYAGNEKQIIPTKYMYAKLEPKKVPVAQVNRAVPMIPGLRGTFFGTKDLSGTAVLTRVDPILDFTWDAAPAPGLPADNFSARWEGFVEAPVAGEYRFYALSDDGIRVWVNDKLVIDNWNDKSPTEDASGPVTLTTGQRVPIRVEYYEAGGNASLRLLWSYPNQEKQIIPRDRFFSSRNPSPK